MSSKKTTIDEEFPKRLRILIDERLKITQGEFAKKVGITAGYVSMVVTGKRGPSAELIAGMFIHYSEHLAWLLNSPSVSQAKQSSGKEGNKLKPQSRKFELLDEFEEWLGEEVRMDPKRKDWFELQLLDSFSAFREWKQKRAEEDGGGFEFPASKVA